MEKSIRLFLCGAAKDVRIIAIHLYKRVNATCSRDFIKSALILALWHFLHKQRVHSVTPTAWMVRTPNKSKNAKIGPFIGFLRDSRALKRRQQGLFSTWHKLR